MGQGTGLSKLLVSTPWSGPCIFDALFEHFWTMNSLIRLVFASRFRTFSISLQNNVVNKYIDIAVLGSL